MLLKSILDMILPPLLLREIAPSIVVSSRNLAHTFLDTTELYASIYQEFAALVIRCVRFAVSEHSEHLVGSKILLFHRISHCEVWASWLVYINIITTFITSAQHMYSFQQSLSISKAVDY